MTRRMEHRCGAWTNALVLIAVIAATDPSGIAGEADRAKPRFRPDRILVKLKPAANAAAVHAAANAQVVRTFHRLGGIQVVRLPGGAKVEDVIAQYKAGGQVEYAEPDYEVRLVDTPNDPSFSDGSLWGLYNYGQNGGTAGADISAVRGWDIRNTAPDVIVAVIDTGVRYTHEDLAVNMWTNPGETPGNGLDDDNDGYVDDVYGINAITGSGNPMDDHGHGTHVSGTIGAAGNNSKGVIGVTRRVKLMGCKFLGANGSGYTSDAIECIDYARNHGAHVMSNSWSGGSYLQALKDAITAAGDAGIVFVAAASNNSSDNDTTPRYPASYDCPSIVVVAATTRTDSLASFSNYGATTVDIGAPGEAILSCGSASDTAYATMSGTSMATPHVSGALALMKAQYPSASCQQLISLLLGNTDPIPALAGKCVSGGRLNLCKALGGVMLNPEPPVTPGISNTISWTAYTGQAAMTAVSENMSPVAGAAVSQVISRSLEHGVQSVTSAVHSEAGASSSGVAVPRTPETEHLFDPADTVSTGVLIVTPSAESRSSSNANPLATQDDAGTSATEYLIMWNWSGSVAIPDVGGWVGINCNTPSNIPSGSVVTKVSVHHEITHPYIGDLEVKVYNASHTWIVRDNEGGSADNINETRTTSSVFAGDNPVQSWYYRVQDTASADVGTLTSMQLYVYYTPPLPDLVPNLPSQWNDKIPVGTTQLAASATHSYAGSYYDNQVLYFNWSSTNSGNASAGGYQVHVEVTGTGGGSWDWNISSNSQGQYWWLTNDQGVGPLAAGNHTFRVWMDHDGTVEESNESNNYYERTITVLATPKPDLTPYPPSNWNDRIPVGVTQLGGGDPHNYSGGFYDNRTLYFNWASFNFGTANAGSYTVRFEIVGTGGAVWNYAVSGNAVNEGRVLPVDQGFVPPSAGQYTFRMSVDSGNSVSESNENNNYYERTITVTSSVVEYYAECASNASFSSPMNSGWTTGLQWTFTGLTPGQTYWYRVKARRAGVETGWSNVEHSQQEPPAVISVTPTSQDFGAIPVGSTADRTFTVQNTGSGTLSGTATVPTPFSIVSGGTYNVSAGATHTVTVRYSPTAFGPHNQTVAFTGGGGTTRAVTGTTSKATPVITWSNPADITYGAALSSTQLNATANPPGGAFDYTPAAGAFLSAGNGQTLSVTYTPTDTVNYNSVTQTVTINVLKKALLVTAENKSRTYGQANPAFSASITGFVNGDTSTVVSGAPALSTAATTASPVGTYPISAALGTLSAANYSFSFVSGTLTVTKATLIVRADDKTKTYGVPNPAFTATYSGFVNGDSSAVVSGSPALSTTATVGSPVGTYSIVAAQGTLSAANYSFSFGPGALSITKAVLTVRADDKSKVYGQPNPGLTSAITGFVNGDPSSVVSGLPALSTTAMAASPVGLYPITVAQGTLSAANYNFSFASGTLTVTKAVLVVRADDKTREYGQPNPSFSVTITGFVNGDTAVVISGTPLLTTPATPASPVGTYPITLEPGTLLATNYSFTFIPGTLTVTKALLTVRADDKRKVQGQANPLLSATITGFLNGDSQGTALSGTPTLSTTATVASPVGTYPITASQGTLVAANYSFAFLSGTLSVTVYKPMLLVTADDKSRVYGQNNPALTATITGFINGDTPSVVSGVPSISTSATPSVAVGSYPIMVAMGTLSAANYDFDFAPGTLTVTKAALRVQADGKSRAYGQPNPVLTATYEGFVNGDNAASLDTPVSLSTTATGNSVVGAYTISATGGADANYDLTHANGTLMIVKATATVSLANLDHTYDGTAKSATATTIPAGLSVALTYDGLQVAPVGVGRYVVVATVNDANYQGSASGTVTIGTVPPVIASGPLVISWKDAYTPEFWAAADQPVTWTWHFGDGTTANATQVIHTYNAKGTYAVKATATNSSGQSTSKTLQVSIPNNGDEPEGSRTGLDSDGDGFPDEVEQALRTAAGDAFSTPFGIGPVVPQPLYITRMNLNLHFSCGGADSIRITGALPGVNTSTIAGKTVVLNVGGVIRTFMLDERGKADRGALLIKQPNRNWGGYAKLTVKLTRGSFAGTLADEQLTNQDISKAPRVVPVLLILHQAVYMTRYPVTYTARAGQGGRAK